MRHLFLTLMLMTGCAKHVVRDANVYETELNQYDTWAVQQAALLKDFMSDSCECSDTGDFTTERCADAADYVLTIEARHEWHKKMSLYLAGISEKKPAKDPPAIPASSTLCPE